MALPAHDKLLVEHKELIKLELTKLEFTKIEQDTAIDDMLEKSKDN